MKLSSTYLLASRGCRALVLGAVICRATPSVTQAAMQASVPTAAPVPESSNSASSDIANEYIVGEADVLRINVWKQPEISQSSIVVRPDGMVSLPLIGNVKISGLTTTQIETLLTSRLKEYVTEPRVTVTVSDTASKLVYLIGEVAHPGVYPLVGPVDVLQAIARAGGVTPYAHRTGIFVLRQTQAGKDKEKIKVNYKQVLRGKNAQQNVALLPGDTVVVP
jgi:polysaccharide export outer membrane protein